MASLLPPCCWGDFVTWLCEELTQCFHLELLGNLNLRKTWIFQNEYGKAQLANTKFSGKKKITSIYINLPLTWKRQIVIKASFRWVYFLTNYHLIITKIVLLLIFEYLLLISITNVYGGNNFSLENLPWVTIWWRGVVRALLKSEAMKAVSEFPMKRTIPFLCLHTQQNSRESQNSFPASHYIISLLFLFF